MEFDLNFTLFAIFVLLVVYYVYLNTSKSLIPLPVNPKPIEPMDTTPYTGNANPDVPAEYIADPSIRSEVDTQPPEHYLLDSSLSFAQINPRDYIIDDEKGQTKIVKFNKDHITDLDGQVIAENGETVLGFPSTSQLIGHEYSPFDYVAQYSHALPCYPRKRAIDAIGSNFELPRICDFGKCPKQ